MGDVEEMTEDISGALNFATKTMNSQNVNYYHNKMHAQTTIYDHHTFLKELVIRTDRERA